MEMKKTTITTIITILLVYQNGSEVDAKIFTRCQVTKELVKFDFPRNFLSNWVCLIEHESGRSTSKVMQQENMSVNYGLFQINSKNWCRKGRRGGLCNMKCEDFLNDDIQDDVRCAKQIYNRNGLKAWNGWLNKCRGRNLPDVSRC